MIEERRAAIEAHLDSLRELRKAYLSHYRFLEGNAPEEYLSSILDDVNQLEVEIMEVRKKLPPQDEVEKLLNEANKILNSDEKHLYLTELDKAERKLSRARRIINQRVVDKAHEEALNEALHRDLWARFDKPKEEALCEATEKDLESTAKRFEEAREEHGTPVWKVDKDSPVGGIFIDKDNVAHVKGMIETSRMVIVEAPRRTGRTFRNWLCNYFK
ncbi:hypothetical protein EG103P2_00018 [Enterococcus phage EG103P2]|nr:hypothetical protein EG103P2_00018 [Enterococcus phage EG103P2]